MVSQPNISVILPTYNRGHLVERAIRSVLNQSYDNFELIIIDDGSLDNTRVIVENIKDSRIRYIRTDSNRGVSAARNEGIKASRGKLIAFQDSDDEWMPRKLEKQISEFYDNLLVVDVVYTDMLRVLKDGTIDYWHAPEILDNNIINKDTLDFRGSNLVPQQILIKKTCFDHSGLFDENLKNMVDLDLFIRLTKCAKFKHIKEPLVVYYDTNGISMNIKNFILSRVYLLNKYSSEICQENASLSKQYGYIINAVMNLEFQYIQATKEAFMSKNKILNSRQDQLKSFLGYFYDKLFNRQYLYEWIRDSIFKKCMVFLKSKLYRSLYTTEERSEDKTIHVLRIDELNEKKYDLMKFDLAMLCSCMAFSNKWYEPEFWHGASSRWMSDSAQLAIYSGAESNAILSLDVMSHYRPRTLILRSKEGFKVCAKIPTNFISIRQQIHLRKGFNLFEITSREGCEKPCNIGELNEIDRRCISMAFQNMKLTRLNSL